MGEVVAFKRPAGLPANWTDAQLLTAVKAHVFGGDIASILGVGEKEAVHWTQTSAWGHLTKLVLPELKEYLTNQLSRIATKSLIALDDRITNGDPVIQMDGSPKVDDDGNQIYRPLKAKDLAVIAEKVMTQQRALESKIGPIEDDEGKISLDKLAEGLRRYAMATEIQGERA